MSDDFYKDMADRLIENADNQDVAGVTCEVCGSDEITVISYGLPAWIRFDDDYVLDPRIEKYIKEKRIVLGGCVVKEDSPKYFCRKCSAKFGSI